MAIYWSYIYCIDNEDGRSLLFLLCPQKAILWPCFGWPKLSWVRMVQRTFYRGVWKTFPSTVNKIAQIHSQFNTWFVADRMEKLWEEPWPVIWEWYEPTGPVEVDEVLRTVSPATCSLDPCPSWLVKVAWGAVSCEWVLAVVNASLSEELLLCLLMRLWFLPLQEALLYWTIFIHYLVSPLGGGWLRR